MPNRTGKQIRDRYINVLDTEIKKGKWTIEEDCVVIKSVRKGNKWSEVSRELTGRPENMVKNRFYAVIKKKVPKEVLLQIQQGKIKAAEFPEILRSFIIYQNEEEEEKNQQNQQDNQKQLTFQEIIPQEKKEEEEQNLNNSANACSFGNFSQFINLGDSQQLFQQAHPNELLNEDGSKQIKGFQLANKSMNSSNISSAQIQQIPLNLSQQIQQNWNSIAELGQYKIGLFSQLQTPIEQLKQQQQLRSILTNQQQFSNYYQLPATLERLSSNQGSIGSSRDFNFGSIAKQGMSMEMSLYPKENGRSLMSQLNASLTKSNDEHKLQNLEESAVDLINLNKVLRNSQQNKALASLASSNFMGCMNNNSIFGRQKQEEDQELALQKVSNIANGIQ